jgi:hypothetical protein
LSIEDDTTVDGMGIEAATGFVVLLISDHLDWADTSQHLATLERKINAYLEFLKSGQLVERLPGAAGRKPKITLCHQFDPTPDATRVLSALVEKLASIGVGFSYSALPPNY